MNFILFFLYLGIFSWLLTKSSFVKNAGLPIKIILALFVIKVFSGCFNFWVMFNINGNPDTVYFNLEGFKEYQLFFDQPRLYLTNIFFSGYQNGYTNLLGFNSYWNDLSSNIIIKFLSVCDILSFGNIYINILIYNYVVFFGSLAVYRLYANVYSNKKYLLILTCFFLPSALFYSSAIIKDGFIYAALGLMIYNINALLELRKFKFKILTFIILLLLLIFFIRNYVFIALVPAIFGWVLSSIKKYNPLVTFSITYLIGFFIFFNAGFITPALNLPQSITNKQFAFEQLPGASTHILLDTLFPNFKSFINNAPQAIGNSILRPYFTDIKLSKYLLPQAFEIFCYQFILLLFISFKEKKIVFSSYIIFCLFFSFSLLLIIGYTIPIIGALVRYRSIYLPFILTPIICNINWKRIIQKIYIKK